MFETPIVLFTYKRTKNLGSFETLFAALRPRKLYIFNDGPRTEEEAPAVVECRRAIKNMSLPRDTAVEYIFRDRNYGCFRQIAGGAYEVFDREDAAIFLEDDNIPCLTFFSFCEQSLHRYRNDDRVFMVFGTNYISLSRSRYSAGFTRHFLPCGWASWKAKFTKFYHLDFQNYLTEENVSRAQKNYFYAEMFNHDRTLWETEYRHYEETGSYLSWDFQLCFYLRLYDLVGVLPKYNQIINNGIDGNNTHGGGDPMDRMTRALCPCATKPLDPLVLPDEVVLDRRVEKRINRIRIPTYYLPPLFRCKARLRKYAIVRAFAGILRGPKRGKNGE